MAQSFEIRVARVVVWRQWVVGIAENARLIPGGKRTRVVARIGIKIDIIHTATTRRHIAIPAKGLQNAHCCGHPGVYKRKIDIVLGRRGAGIIHQSVSVEVTRIGEGQIHQIKIVEVRVAPIIDPPRHLNALFDVYPAGDDGLFGERQIDDIPVEIVVCDYERNR